MTMKKLQQHYDKDIYGGDDDDVDDDTEIGPVLFSVSCIQANHR